MRWEIEKIIDVAIALLRGGGDYASTGERIAAAFVLNRPDFFPDGYKRDDNQYDMVAAWDRLGEDWQRYVVTIRANCMGSIESQGEGGA
jgi:hypothetical protein